MDSLEKLEREVAFLKECNSRLSDMLDSLQKEKARTVRLLQQKQAELARLKQVRLAKARRVMAV
ncbi:hypothetical protein [Thermococcus sp.]|uniref:hypothetical protein n=1 Tax=Thermococcus sp. TaxID=35749 RepID=UPI00260F1137|nr:hypothetical protein [Thermococcus sp.]